MVVLNKCPFKYFKTSSNFGTDHMASKGDHVLTAKNEWEITRDFIIGISQGYLREIPVTGKGKYRRYPWDIRGIFL